MIFRKCIFLFLIICLFTGNIKIIAQNQKAPGYMGLWSRSEKSPEYGYKYSGGMGTFSSQHRPMAIYSPTAGKTYFVYSGTSNPDESHLQIMISYYDHRSHLVPKPVVVHDKMGVNDPRDNASIAIDTKGYLWVFISGRGRTRPGLIYKSTLPGSIDNFELIMEDEILFPQPFWMKDSCFFLLHSKLLKGRELYWTSSTDGRNWSKSSKIAGMGGHFQVSGAYGNSVFTAFNYCPDGDVDKRTNLYLLKTDDFGRTWKSIDNKVVETPVTALLNDALIKDFESEKQLVFINDLNFDAEGNPVIVAIISRDIREGVIDNSLSLIVINWKGGKWNFNKVCDVDHNYDTGPIYTSAGEWEIIAPTGKGPVENRTGGEMVQWVSRNEGRDWEKSTEITSGSIRNNSFPRRPRNNNKEFYSFWVDGDPDKLSPSQLFFTNQKCNKVWMLPFKMNKDFERPVRIK
jgi:hypothetical protein